MTPIMTGDIFTLFKKRSSGDAERDGGSRPADTLGLSAGPIGLDPSC
jgi:hypothetical protein